MQNLKSLAWARRKWISKPPAGTDDVAKRIWDLRNWVLVGLELRILRCFKKNYFIQISCPYLAGPTTERTPVIGPSNQIYRYSRARRRCVYIFKMF